MSGARITLEEAIKDLREQLQNAAVEGANKAIRFVPKSVEVELSIELDREGSTKAKAGIWSVLDVSGEAKLGDKAAHKVRLVLEPVSPDGKPAVIGSSVLEK